jgi:hypothetical protein
VENPAVSDYITIRISKRLVIGFLLVMLVLFVVTLVLSSTGFRHSQVGPTQVHHQGPAGLSTP